MDGIDPRLRGPSQSQIYSNIPPSQYPQPPIILPPPSPQQQHQQQLYQQPNQQQHASSPPLWPQYGGYYQQTPNASPTNMYPHGGATMAPPSSNGQATGEPKRPRACEACRGLKVRCEFDRGSRDCRRCMKAARQCQVTQPSRKRQKKTDTKVAELEKKLEDLRSELVAKGNLPVGVNDRPNRYEEGDNIRLSTLDPNNPGNMAHGSPTEGERRHHILPRKSYGGPIQQSSSNATSPALATRKRRMSSNAEDEDSYLKQQQISSPVSFHKPQPFGPYRTQATASPSDPSSIHPFMMAQAAYSKATEGAIHDHSESKMAFVDIVAQYLPHHEKAYAAFHHYIDNVAPQTPLVVFQPGISPEHVRETRPVLFSAIVAIAYEGDIKPSLINGVKEILAQQVMIDGRHSVELIQAMLIMSLFYWPENETANNVYINLASTMTLDTGLGHGALEQHFSTWALENSHLSPSELVEGARANLGCYAVGKNAYIGSRFHWWQKFGLTEESSLRLLDTSTDALASDRLLCYWLRMERLADRLYWHSLAGNVLQILPEIEQGMGKCLAQMAAHGVPHTLMMLYHATNLFIYQLVASKTQATGGSDHMDARLASIHGLLEYFLKLTPSQVFNLPVFHFTRVAYALFAMFRVCKTVSNDKLQLPLYLDGVLDLLRKSARKGPNEALHWHLVVVAALHDWMHKSSLHVLSDVATGESTIVNPPQDAKKVFHMVTADSGEYKIVENEQAFLKVLEEAAGRIGGNFA